MHQLYVQLQTRLVSSRLAGARSTCQLLCCIKAPDNDKSSKPVQETHSHSRGWALHTSLYAAVTVTVTETLMTMVIEIVMTMVIKAQCNDTNESTYIVSYRIVSYRTLYSKRKISTIHACWLNSFCFLQPIFVRYYTSFFGFYNPCLLNQLGCIRFVFCNLCVFGVSFLFSTTHVCWINLDVSFCSVSMEVNNVCQLHSADDMMVPKCSFYNNTRILVVSP